MRQSRRMAIGAGVAAALIAVAAPAASAQEWTAERPDGHAPVGVTGDHTHEAGEYMFSYRFAHAEVRGNRNGTTRLSDADVLESFPVAPTSMTVDTHLFGFMWAPSDGVTVMIIVPFFQVYMDHVTQSGERFTTESDGMGDVSVTGLVGLKRSGAHRLHLDAGISLPTGSLGSLDDTPDGPLQPLPYPMQVGSGTLDLRPGLTYLGQSSRWSWGAQVLAIVRLGRNDHDYRLGHRVQPTAWVARKVANSLSVSARLEGWVAGDYRGADPLLDPLVAPSADPKRRGGRSLSAAVGVNWYATSRALQGNRLALEFGVPVYQDLNGPQLETDWTFAAGWQKSF